MLDLACWEHKVEARKPEVGKPLGSNYTSSKRLGTSKKVWCSHARIGVVRQCCWTSCYTLGLCWLMLVGKGKPHDLGCAKICRVEQESQVIIRSSSLIGSVGTMAMDWGCSWPAPCIERVVVHRLDSGIVYGVTWAPIFPSWVDLPSILGDENLILM